MTLIDYAIIVIAMVVVTGVSGLASLAVRKLQKRVPEHPVNGASIIAGSSDPAPEVEVPGSDPLRELSRLPEVGDLSGLPDEAKSVLMNAVWYRCENPKCNYTQFLDVYQIVSRAKGGTNALDNLVVLCPECRTNAHNGQIDDDVLNSWIKGRVERFKFALDWPYR